MSASLHSSLAGEAEWREAGAPAGRGRSDARQPLGRRGPHAHGAARSRRRARLSSTSPATDGAFPSVAALHAPASRLERAACDLFGFTALEAPDGRRWLDHGRWPLRHPLGRPVPHDGAADAYAFLEAEGPGLHQIPVGPVHAGIIEPGHFRFHAGGEAVVRLEERLGYVHKGVDRLMRGASLERAGVLAARVSGDSTVAYAVAFARAVEAALGVEAPARAHGLRGVMAELERIANHFGDIGAICNDAAFALMHAHCGILRERTLRAAKAAFGHRLMMDAVVPGGVAVDLAPEGAEAIRALVARSSRDLSEARPALRQHRFAAGPHGRDGRAEGRSRAPFRRGRRRRPRVGPRFRRAPRPSLSALRRSPSSRFRRGATATSTPASGSGSTRSARAST